VSVKVVQINITFFFISDTSAHSLPYIFDWIKVTEAGRSLQKLFFNTTIFFIKRVRSKENY
jgi:hypothetical protein